MELNDRQRLVMAGVLKDHFTLLNLPTGGDTGLPREQLGRRRLVVGDARDGYVPMNLSVWIGHVPSNSECVLFHREYARLEGMGLLVRHNLRGGRRTSHLKLTAAGRWIAEGLLAEESPAAASEQMDFGDLDLSPIDLSDLAGTPTDATTAS